MKKLALILALIAGGCELRTAGDVLRAYGTPEIVRIDTAHHLWQYWRYHESDGYTADFLIWNDSTIHFEWIR